MRGPDVEKCTSAFRYDDMNDDIRDAVVDESVHRRKKMVFYPASWFGAMTRSEFIFDHNWRSRRLKWGC